MESYGDVRSHGSLCPMMANDLGWHPCCRRTLRLLGVGAYRDYRGWGLGLQPTPTRDSSFNFRAHKRMVKSNQCQPRRAAHVRAAHQRRSARSHPGLPPPTTPGISASEALVPCSFLGGPVPVYGLEREHLVLRLQRAAEVEVFRRIRYRASTKRCRASVLGIRSCIKRGLTNWVWYSF